MRVSELVSLQLGSISRDRRFLTVIGKGKKERLLPLNDIARETLMEYLSEDRRGDNTLKNSIFLCFFAQKCQFSKIRSKWRRCSPQDL